MPEFLDTKKIVHVSDVTILEGLSSLDHPSEVSLRVGLPKKKKLLSPIVSHFSSCSMDSVSDISGMLLSGMGVILPLFLNPEYYLKILNESILKSNEYYSLYPEDLPPAERVGVMGIKVDDGTPLVYIQRAIDIGCDLIYFNSYHIGNKSYCRKLDHIIEYSDLSSTLLMVGEARDTSMALNAARTGVDMIMVGDLDGDMLFQNLMDISNTVNQQYKDIKFIVSEKVKDTLDPVNVLKYCIAGAKAVCSPVSNSVSFDNSQLKKRIFITGYSSIDEVNLKPILTLKERYGCRTRS